MDTVFISLICLWPLNWVPRDWTICDGRLLDVNQNMALFSLISNIYGGDGHNNFAIPDLRGRVPVGAGHAPGTSYYNLGQKSGMEYISLQAAQMPSHSHGASFNSGSVTIKASSDSGTEKVPGTNNASTLAASDQGRDPASNIYNSETPSVDLNVDPSFEGAVTIDNAGGGQAHYNVQPFTCVNYMIALEGLYPPRS